MTSYLITLTVTKFIMMRFLLQINITFFLGMTKILHMQNHIRGISREQQHFKSYDLLGYYRCHFHQRLTFLRLTSHSVAIGTRQAFFNSEASYKRSHKREKVLYVVGFYKIGGQWHLYTDLQFVAIRILAPNVHNFTA